MVPPINSIALNVVGIIGLEWVSFIPNLKLEGLGVELAFNVSIATHLHVIFPMNALAISSGALSFEDPNLVLECSQATPSENLEI